MKYFWPVTTFGFMFILCCQDKSLFFIMFLMSLAYLLHKGTEKFKQHS